MSASLNKFLVLWLSIVLVSLSCATTNQTVMAQKKKPAWTKNLPNIPQKPGYYTGLGIVKSTGNDGQDKNDAESQARAQIVQAIRSEISSKVESSVSESMSSSGGVETSDYTESFASVTSSFAQETLEKLKVDSYFDKKKKKSKSTWYAYAEISIAEVDKQFAERTQKAVNLATTYYAAGVKALSSADFYLALDQFMQGAKEVVLAELILRKTIEGDIDGDGSKEPVKAALDTRLKEILSKMSISVVSGDGQKGAKNEPLAQPLVAKITYENSKPVKNANMAFSFQSPAAGKVDSETKSDGSGTFKATVHSLDAISESGVNKIRAGLNISDFEAFRDQLPGAVEKARLVFKDFEIKTRGARTTRIAMIIFEYNIGQPRPSTVQGKILKKLISGKYKVVDESEIYAKIDKATASGAAESGDDDIVRQAMKDVADIIVIGYVKAEESDAGGDTGYGTSKQKSAWASASIRAIDLESNKIIANTELEGVKGIWKTMKQAGEKAIQKISEKIEEELVTGLNNALK